DDQTSAPARLHIAPVPVAMMFRHRQKRRAVAAIPVVSIAAPADHDFVRLGTILWLAAPDGGRAEHDALLSNAIEVIELRAGLEIVTEVIEFVGADPVCRVGFLV